MIINPTSELRLQYKLVRDSYTGQGGFSTGEYLFGYGREQDLSQRKEMAAYTNYVKPIVDVRVDAVFNENPARVYEDNEIIDAFLKDCDNNGTILEDFIHEATRDTVLLGNSFIIMDNFPANEIPETLQEVIDTRKFPYVYSKSVLDVYEYETDLFGKLQSITFYYGLYDGAKEGSEVYLYKRFTKKEIEYFTIEGSKDGDIIQTISLTSHSLGRVPVAYYNNDILPFSPYYSMATLARKIYNIDSELTDLERAQMFSILLIPSISPGNEPKDNIVVSTSNALFYDSQSTNKPEYISPDSNIMKVQMENRQSSMDNLLQSADVLGSTAIANSNNSSSGISMQYQFFGKQQGLIMSSNIANSLETQVMELLGLFFGIDYEYYVKYTDNFSPTFTEMQQKISVLQSIADMEISDNVDANINADIVTLVSEFMKWDDDRLRKALESIVEVEEIV